MTLEEIKKQHPMPWRAVKMPLPGQFSMADANGLEVSLLALLEFAQLATAKLASPGERGSEGAVKS